LAESDSEEAEMHTGARVMIANELLARLVCDEVERQIAQGKAFTAYNVTRALRRQQPQLEIPHARVRLVVHSIMRHLGQCGKYEAAPVQFHDGEALLYVPGEARVVPPSLPLLPLN
jgi:hypothetical protein